MERFRNTTWYVRIDGVDSVMTIRATGLPEFQFLVLYNGGDCQGSVKKIIETIYT
jgi:hypothetical protein